MKRSIFILLSLCFIPFLSSQQPTAEQIEILNSLPPEIQERILNETNSDVINKANSLELTEDSIKENDDKPVPGFFGYGFFDKKTITNSPVLDIPLQADYEISFADELFLLLTGGQDESYNLKVDMSGTVLIPNIGSVSLKDMTLFEAEEKLQKIIQKLYSGTNASLSITKASLKKISVIGAVKKPGTYIVNPFISVSEAIKYADGLVDNSSLRNLKIQRLNGDLIEVDLYDFLIFGDRSSDVNLKNGDTLIIEATSKYIRIDGAVLRNGTYEFTSSDTYNDLIDFAQGLIYSADKEKAVLTFIDSSNKIVTKNLNFNEKLGDIIAQSLYTPTKIFARNKKIIVKGSDINDGEFDLENFKNVGELVSNLDFGPDIYPFYFQLIQESDDGQTIESLSLSLNDPKTYEDIPFKNNPELYFYNRFDIFNADLSISNSNLLDLNIGDFYVKIPVAGKFSPKDLFNYFGRNGIFNFQNTSTITEDGTFVNSFNNIFTFKPFTSVSIPFFMDKKIKVLINGEVKFPGEYIVSRNTTLEQIYNIAGGISEIANKDGIFLSRVSNKEKEKQTYDKIKDTLVNAIINSINNNIGSGDINLDLSLVALLEKPIENFAGRISGDLSPGSFTAMKTYLENSDYIFVPPITNTISVTGEVQIPTSIVFNKNLSVKDYIDRSGGLSRLASARDIYIYKSNGESISLSNAFFSKKYNLVPGDTIVIPRNIDKVSTLPLFASISQILSNLTLSAASLNAIQNQ